jgi:hypothetical protein
MLFKYVRHRQAFSIHFAQSSTCAHFHQIQQMHKHELLHHKVLLRVMELRCDLIKVNYHILTLTAEPACL